MKQAKVLSESELKRVLAVIASRKHAARNRAALMLSFYAGMRVGEIAALTVKDVLNGDSQVKDQVLLRGAITKTGEARAVFVGDKLRKELERYVAALKVAQRPGDTPFLLTQKQTAFSPNTLCQLFTNLYAAAGIDGASSHRGGPVRLDSLAAELSYSPVHDHAASALMVTMSGACPGHGDGAV